LDYCVVSIHIIAKGIKDSFGRGRGIISVGQLMKIVGNLYHEQQSAETVSFAQMAPVGEALAYYRLVALTYMICRNSNRC
jgi:hypothetical protein